jgi:hypothetical protein
MERKFSWSNYIQFGLRWRIRKLHLGESILEPRFECGATDLAVKFATSFLSD